MYGFRHPHYARFTPLATITRRGTAWRVQVCKAGVRTSRTFARKAEATAWAAHTETAISSGTFGSPALDTLADVMARYAAEVSPTKRGAKWEILRLSAMSSDPLAAHRIASLTPDMLGVWRDRRLQSVSAGTVLREITLLTAVIEHARREWRLLTVNPIRDMRKPRQPKHRERLISTDEIDRITLALGYDEESTVLNKSWEVAVMFMLSIETAMRAGELIGLTWADVDLNRRVARIRKSKNDDARDVPLSSRAVELFGKIPHIEQNVFSVGAGSRDTLFRKARIAAGIHDLHFHDARAEACTRLAKRLDVLELARMIGHRDLKSLMIYFRETAEDIAKKLV